MVALDDVGVAFDMVDVDDDGNLEVVTTAAVDPGARDQIAVHRLDAGTGALRLLWRSTPLGESSRRSATETSTEMGGSS